MIPICRTAKQMRAYPDYFSDQFYNLYRTISLRKANLNCSPLKQPISPNKTGTARYCLSAGLALPC